jgi:signal recognition particle subunit SRP54
MFETLSEKLQRVFKNLRGEGRLTELHIEEALKEIRIALLEADVNFKVVKQFTDTVRTKALGQEVLQSLSPGQQVVKIVRDELVEILGGENVRVNFTSQPPTVIMLVGLQGSGKTTSSGKLAKWLVKNGHRPTRRLENWLNGLSRMAIVRCSCRSTSIGLRRATN